MPPAKSHSSSPSPAWRSRWQQLREHLQHPDQRWKWFIFVGVIVYLILINQVTNRRPDHYFFALLVFSFVLGRARAKRFLLDWLPFILFWVAYDMMRGIADTVRGAIHVTAPYRLEHWFFQWLPGMAMPPFDLQTLRFDQDWHWLKVTIDLLAGNLYVMHFALPLVLGWIFWHTTNDRPMFYKFVYTLTTLNLLALITFMLYPAAPPWYVYSFGFGQPEPNSTFWGTSAGRMIDIDRFIGFDFFTTLWGKFNANHFAAIPSLHGAYPIVIVFFAYKKFRRYLGLMVLYPLGVWFSAVYLNQHYVVDLLIGGLYIFAAYAIATRLLYPKIFARFVEPKEDASRAMTPAAS